MAENKTKPTTESADAFLNKVQDEEKRNDCFEIMKLMQAATKEKPVMWGSSIIGFGSYHYVYESGREGDFLLIGFAPRKQNISIYLTSGLKAVQPELSKLGKYKIGGGCLYIKSLSDVNSAILKKIFAKAFKEALRIKKCYA